MRPVNEPTLREFQQWMKARIRSGFGPAAPADSAAPVMIRGGASGAERVADVYGGGYLTRTREALAEVYEAVHMVLGPRRFAALAAAYTEQHPSHEYNLSFFGRQLEDWLEASAWHRALPFLPDLARLEWLVCQAFHAFDDPPAEASRFASLPVEAWERARFQFQPSMGLIASAWPIRDIWVARSQPRDTIDIALASRPHHLMVHRRGTEVVCEVVEPEAFTLLQHLADGQPLAAACAALASAVEPSSLTGWFSHWTAQGLIRAVVPE